MSTYQFSSGFLKSADVNAIKTMLTSMGKDSGFSINANGTTSTVDCSGLMTQIANLVNWPKIRIGQGGTAIFVINATSSHLTTPVYNLKLGSQNVESSSGGVISKQVAVYGDVKVPPGTPSDHDICLESGQILPQQDVLSAFGFYNFLDATAFYGGCGAMKLDSGDPGVGWDVPLTSSAAKQNQGVTIGWVVRYPGSVSSHADFAIDFGVDSAGMATKMDSTYPTSTSNFRGVGPSSSGNYIYGAMRPFTIPSGTSGVNGVFGLLVVYVGP